MIDCGVIQHIHYKTHRFLTAPWPAATHFLAFFQPQHLMYIKAQSVNLTSHLSCLARLSTEATRTSPSPLGLPYLVKRWFYRERVRQKERGRVPFQNDCDTDFCFSLSGRIEAKCWRLPAYQVFDGFLILIYFSQRLIVSLDFVNVLSQVL